jgi:undecaprenyl pyrophosphate synthase
MGESEVKPLWEELKLIRDAQIEHVTLLGQHMQNSARHSEEIRSEVVSVKNVLDQAVADTQKIYASMPEDEHGRASPFIHKVHHGIIKDGERDKRADASDRRKISVSFWSSVASVAGKLLAALAIGLILGEKAAILIKPLLGG